MDLREWLKSAAVAVGGGACAAISAMLMDPTKFNLSNGLKDEFLIALQGGLVGLGALLIRSPLGTSLMKALASAKAQSAADQQTIAQLKQRLRGDAPETPPTGSPPMKK